MPIAEVRPGNNWGDENEQDMAREATFKFAYRFANALGVLLDEHGMQGLVHSVEEVMGNDKARVENGMVFSELGGLAVVDFVARGEQAEEADVVDVLAKVSCWVANHDRRVMSEASWSWLQRVSGAKMRQINSIDPLEIALRIAQCSEYFKVDDELEGKLRDKLEEYVVVRVY